MTVSAMVAQTTMISVSSGGVHQVSVAEYRAPPCAAASPMYSCSRPPCKIRSPFFGSNISPCTSKHTVSRPRASEVTSIDAIHFQAGKSVAIPCEEREFSVDAYLSDTHRVVRVVFPDSDRLQYQGDQTWRARLRPVSFFTISATPVCDLRSWFENGALRIFSDRVVLDIAGLPSQFHNVNLKLLLEGQLFAVRGDSDSKREQGTLEGWVRMSLNFDLPYPFSMFPERVVVGVGNAILDGILSAMQGALIRGLGGDYRLWASERAVLKARQSKLGARRPSMAVAPRKV